MSYLLEQQNLSDYGFLLENSVNAIEDSLQNFANLPGFDEQMTLAFGVDIDVHWLKQDWRSHNFNFPEIEIVSSQQINGANGAFSSQTNKIYLAQEFLLANQSDLEAVTAVLLEEYGHYIDSQVNSRDTPGDEGAIFSAVVRGEELTDSELQQLRNEDDSAVVMIDGKEVAIEQNELIVESLFDATIYKVLEEVPVGSGNYVDRGEEVNLFAGASVTGSNWWNLIFPSENIEQVGIIEFSLPNPETITPNTDVILRLYDIGGKGGTDDPQDISGNTPATDNSIIVSGYIGDGEATVSDRNISASQITTITTDAGQRRRNQFDLGEPYLVDVTDFVVNAINSGEEFVGFRFDTNQASTLEGFVGPGFDDPIELVFESTETQSTVEFQPNIIRGIEGEQKKVIIKRTGELDNPLTVNVTIDPSRPISDLVSSSFDFATDAGIVKTISDVVRDGVNAILRASDIPLELHQSITSTVLGYLLNIIGVGSLFTSGYDQTRATFNDVTLSTTTVTFDPEEDTIEIPITFEDDTEREGTQSFYIDLSSPQDPTIQDKALGIILDNDRTNEIGIDFENQDDRSSLTTNIITSSIIGAIAGIPAGGVGAIPGAIIGAVTGAIGGTALTQLGEIIENAIQDRIIDYQVVGISDADESSLIPNFTDAISAGDSDTLDIDALGGFASGGDGNDTISGNIGDDIINGDAGADVLTGGAGSDSITGGAGADTLTGGADSDIFAGDVDTLNQDVITDFTGQDVIIIDNTLLSDENITITEGSAIIDIDLDLDGTSDATITLEGDFAGKEFTVESYAIGDFQTSSIAIANPDPVIDNITGETVYRFFNPNAGVHFYTASEVERDVVLELPNYTFEGESYNTVDPLSGGAEDVYRFFNRNTGVHLYTTDENERDFIIENLADFTFEETAFSAYETEAEGAIPVHRFYEPTIGVHFYTPNEGERTFVEDNLSNYNYEGIAYYAFPLEQIV